MTFKEAYEQFVIDYHNECVNRNARERKFHKKEIVTHLSKAYAYLGNTYKLIDTSDTIDLVLGQAVYTTGSGASNLPEDVLEIYQVKLNDDAGTPLLKVGLYTEPPGERAAGLPGTYTIHGTNANRVLEIDTTPDKSYSLSDTDYRLLVYYKQKVFRYSGTAAKTFVDLDFAAADWGGEFNLPTEWEDLIIKGAVGMAMSNAQMISEFYMMAADMNKRKPVYMKSKLKYHFGVRRTTR